jgi:triosephosphate isomerase
MVSDARHDPDAEEWDMRKKFVAGNWKMYTTRATARELATAVVRGLGGEDRVTVAVCPPFPYLEAVAACLEGSPVALGAQNVYPEKEGAFTGEVGLAMLQDLGCRYIIVGHSERRHVLGESDTLINRKVHAALGAGFQVILGVGETLQEREANRTESVLDAQLRAGLAGLKAEQFGRLVLAYEPVWAIGTGRTATPQQAQEAHAFLRQRVAKLVGEEVAHRLPIQYGGSVKPENVRKIMMEPDVDGALVGGCSLKAEEFLAIVRAAVA